MELIYFNVEVLHIFDEFILKCSPLLELDYSYLILFNLIINLDGFFILFSKIVKGIQNLGKVFVAGGIAKAGSDTFDQGSAILKDHLNKIGSSSNNNTEPTPNNTNTGGKSNTDPTPNNTNTSTKK